MEDLTVLMSHLNLTKKERLQYKISGRNVLPDLVEKLIKSATFRESFTKLTNNSDRIQFVLNQEPICRFIEQLSAFIHKLSDECITSGCENAKNYSQAVDFRNNGNRAFGDKRFTVSAALYSDAIRTAPASGNDQNLLKELPFAYGNRSAVYNYLGQYEDAIKDIEAAIFHGYARYKHPLKLLIRKADCLKQLNRFEEAKEVLEKNKPLDLKERDILAEWTEAYQDICKDMKAYVKPKTNKVVNQSRVHPDDIPLPDYASAVKYLTDAGKFEAQPKLASLSTKVIIRYDSENGYHLVTTEDLPYGTTLAITKPYAAIFNKDQDQNQRYCNHCLSRLTDKQILLQEHFSPPDVPSKWIRSVSCLQCTRVLYCSENCRTEAWNTYHRFECSILPTLYNFTGAHLALRTLFTAGGLDSIRKVSQKFNSKTSIEFTDLADYEHVYAMKSDPSTLGVEVLIKLSITACLAVNLAKIGGEFLKDSNKEEELFAAEIVLRHLIQFRVNETIFARSKFIVDKKQIQKEYELDYLPSVDPLIGLVTRSCDPNIYIVPVDALGCNENIAVQLKAIRSIPAGSKVCATFLPHYGCNQGAHILKRMNEQKMAREEKRIKCQCGYCQQLRRDDPDAEDAINFQLGCGNCGGLVSRGASTANPFKCVDCNRQVTIGEIKSVYAKLRLFDGQASKIIDYLQNGFEMSKFNSRRSPLEMIVKLEELVNQKMVPLFYRGSLRLAYLYEKLRLYSQEYAADVSVNFGRDFDKAWNYSEKVLTTLELRFGKNNQFIFDQLFYKMIRPFEIYNGRGRFTDTKQTRELIRRVKKIQERFEELIEKFL